MTDEYAELCNETADMLDAKDERFEKLTDALQTARTERDAALVRVADVEEQLRRVIAGVETALVEPERARSIIKDVHEQCSHVYSGGAPLELKGGGDE